ncbi:TetR/AcrR family transcriptional regulator [Azospirillum sp. RWY-5-1]|uniref:TetR/AcrR family transcriptional regulator n=1 Tax=Azospirillum oleiclasticum TaxID=2735135 RepID=A0ABX2TK18_9PROT|nr:TetR/AcrR family transcriptional regulator [Azospirillum oleiclasticum]NYZ17369.1 TetR/AcrR family transcriptional regulator [Azospirillum oleiclasticum]NYZ24689.1 TetR/AcrR family transcriptional regulator [Azospirillum oleiclasticum]
MTSPTSATTATPRDDRKADQILEAAKAVFLEHGYAGTSMDLVAQSARVSKTTLYARFPSKEALFAATIHAECERRGMQFRAEDFDDLTVEDALCRIGRRFVDLIWSPEAVRVYQLVVGDAARFPEIARIFFEHGPTKGRAAVVTYLQRAHDHGRLRVPDPLFAARELLSMLQGGPWFELTLGVGTAPPPDERDRFVQRVVRLFLGGVERMDGR